MGFGGIAKELVPRYVASVWTCSCLCDFGRGLCGWSCFGGPNVSSHNRVLVHFCRFSTIRPRLLHCSAAGDMMRVIPGTEVVSVAAG